MLCTWAKVHLQFSGARTAGALNPPVYHLHGQPGGTDVFLHQTPRSEFSLSLVLPSSQDSGQNKGCVQVTEKGTVSRNATLLIPCVISTCCIHGPFIYIITDG